MVTTFGRIRTLVLAAAVLLAGFAAVAPHAPQEAEAAGVRCDIITKSMQGVNRLKQPLVGVTFVVELCYNGNNVYKITVHQPKTNVTGTGNLSGWRPVGQATVHSYTCSNFANGTGRYSCGVYVQMHFEAHVGLGAVNQKMGSWSPYLYLVGYYEGTAHCKTWSQPQLHVC